MELVQQVHATIEKYKMTEPGDRVLVAVSGGPDSVALLHILLTLRDELDISLCAAHLNHMFRGEEARRDAAMVSDLALNLGIPVEVDSFDVPGYMKLKKMSAQEAARRVRYKFLEEAARGRGANKIALGHHADDQAETLLFNFLRGAGLSGLKGIVPCRDGRYMRPLLEARRRQIEKYCADNNLPFIQDTSNFKTVYTRNKIRLELIPYLERNYNPGLVDGMAGMAHILRDEENYMQGQAAGVFGDIATVQNDRRLYFDLKKLQKTPPALQRRLIRFGWERVTGSPLHLSYDQVEAVLSLILKGETGKRIELPRGVRVSRGFEGLEMYCAIEKKRIPPFFYELKVPGEVYIKELELSLTAAMLSRANAPEPGEMQPDEALLDAGRLKEPLGVRRRREGDIFHPLGSGGRMKLKKFFNQVKVPAEERDSIPLILSGDDIVWVGGIRPGEPWRVTEDTRRCILLKIRRNVRLNGC